MQQRDDPHPLEYQSPQTTRPRDWTLAKRIALTFLLTILFAFATALGLDHDLFVAEAILAPMGWIVSHTINPQVDVTQLIVANSLFLASVISMLVLRRRGSRR